VSVADLSMLACQAADELALRAAAESKGALASLHALLRRVAHQVAIAEDTTPRTVLDEAFKAAPADPDWNRWAAAAGAHPHP